MTQTAVPATIPAASLPRYALVYGAGEELRSDSLSELIVPIIADYQQYTGDVTPEQVHEATALRVDVLTQLAAVVQAGLVEAAVAAGQVDLSDVDDVTLTELGKDRRIPFQGTAEGVGSSPHWGFDVPLVLIATDYHPFTGRRRPYGNVVLLDGSTEHAFLSSVSSLGLVSFNVLDPSHQNR